MTLSAIVARAEFPSAKLPRGTRFLFGGLLAAIFVLAFAGGSFTLWAAARGAESGEGGLYRLPRPALSLAAGPTIRMS